METSSCPDMLVKKETFYCYIIPKNLQDPKSSIYIFNLDEYINYLEVQKEKGNDCPVFIFTEGNKCPRRRCV